MIKLGFRRALGALALAALIGSAAACSETAAEILVTPEQENELGKAVKAELEATGMVKYLQEPELRTYILGLANSVVAIGKQQRPEFTWNVEVIDDPDQVNAFATPGGYLYVYTGLLRAAENEAEVVGVMGHEVGHVLARHYAQRLVQTYGLQALLAAAVGADPGLLTQLATSLAAQGYMLRHSRAAENEADEYGARLTHAGGYDPQGLVTFFTKLAMLQGNTPGFLQYLSSHPDPSDRSTRIMTFITREKLTGGATNADMFMRMKAKLPPPRVVADGGVRD